jgi:DNA (cytosine-5)-methyltransferase 1
MAMRDIRKKRHYSLRDAARLIGVAPITLRRWLLSGKVAEVARDRNGWRVFNRKEIDRMRRFAKQIRPPSHK